MKGGARAADMNSVIGQLWLTVAKGHIALQVGRVASLANIADEPTRGSADWINRVEAKFLEPIIFDWLADPWLAPDLPPYRSN